MPKRKETSASAGSKVLTFQRARWKRYIRYFGVFVLFWLNVSLVLATIEIHSTHESPDIWRELLSFVIVLFFDVTILLPTLIEADTIWATSEALTVGTIFWKSKIAWPDIVAFHNPVWLTYAILKTRRSFYLINKRDMQPLDELLATIEHKRPRAGETGS